MEEKGQKLQSKGHQVEVMIVAYGATGAQATSPAAVELAQWGAMTKQKPTPVPRQTPVGDREQRQQGAQQRPQAPFGGMHK